MEPYNTCLVQPWEYLWEVLQVFRILRDATPYHAIGTRARVYDLSQAVSMDQLQKSIFRMGSVDDAIFEGAVSVVCTIVCEIKDEGGQFRDLREPFADKSRHRSGEL